MISDDQAAGLVREALGVRPRELTRQTLTESGNEVFHAVLPDGQPVALRVSPQRGMFAGTQHNLKILGELGLPVATVLATGQLAAGGAFIILSWIPGRDLLYELPRMTPGQMTQVAEAVTGHQRRVGTLPLGAAFGWAAIGGNGGAGCWPDIFGAPATDPVPDGAPLLDQLRGRLRTVRQGVEPFLATRRPVCFLDDLTIKNVLVVDGALSGIIDLDQVCYGDPLLSVGTTLALLAAELGEAGRFYGDELIRCWDPAPEELRAIRFYGALWAVGLLSAAEAAGQADRARRLGPVAEAMLGLGEYLTR